MQHPTRNKSTASNRFHRAEITALACDIYAKSIAKFPEDKKEALNDALRIAKWACDPRDVKSMLKELQRIASL